MTRKSPAPAARPGQAHPRRASAAPVGFERVEAVGRTLPGVDVTTTWGQPTLKVNGRMFVCMASNKSAEPNTLVVVMDIAERQALLEEAPDTYYLTEHYVTYPCVLVRLEHASVAALEDLVRGAHRFVAARASHPKRSPTSLAPPARTSPRAPAGTERKPRRG